MSAGTGRESMSQRGQEDCDGCEQPIRGVVNTHGGLMLCDRCFRPWAADKARISAEVTEWMMLVTLNPDGIRDNGCRLGKPPQWWALSDAAGEPLPEVQEAPQAPPRAAPMSQVVRLPTAQPVARPVSTVAIRVPTVEPVRVRRAPEVETRLGSVATVPVYGPPVKVPTRLLVWAEKRAEEQPPVEVSRADQIVQLVRVWKSTTVSRMQQQMGRSVPLLRAELDALTAEGRLERHDGQYIVWTLPGGVAPLTLADQLAALVKDAGRNGLAVKDAAKQLGWDPRTVRNTAKNSGQIIYGPVLKLRAVRTPAEADRRVSK